MTLQTKSAALGLGAGAARKQMRRGGRFDLPVLDFTPGRAKTQMPPPHLAEAEAELWLAAEAVRRTDRPKYLELRRELLLEQSQRYNGGNGHE